MRNQHLIWVGEVPWRACSGAEGTAKPARIRVSMTVVRLLVTSAGSANGGCYGAILSFDSEGEPLEPFSGDPRIADPRGLSLDPSGALVYLNNGDDRVLALDRCGTSCMTPVE
jgi:hypothetical protein